MWLIGGLVLLGGGKQDLAFQVLEVGEYVVVGYGLLARQGLAFDRFDRPAAVAAVQE